MQIFSCIYCEIVLICSEKQFTLLTRNKYTLQFILIKSKYFSKAKTQGFYNLLWNIIQSKWILLDIIYFLSLRVFWLLSSSLLLFLQRFRRYILRASSGACWTREPSRNFELRPLSNPRGSPLLISRNRVLVLSIPVLLLACSKDWTCNLQMIVSLED